MDHPKKRPTVFEFDDYRRYLDAYYQFEKSQRPSFSHRYFSRKAGYRTPSMLRMVIMGKKNLSEHGIRKFMKAMELNQKESAFFKQLVKFNQAETPDEKQSFARDMLRSKVYDALKPLAKAKFIYWSNWYNVAIRELVGLKGFKEDYDLIAKQLNPKITAQEAQTAMNTLLQLGFVIRNQLGILVQSNTAVSSGDDIINASLVAFHQEMIEKAKESFDRFELDERQVTALTMGLTPKGEKKAKEMIDQFRKDLIALANQEKDPTRVVQINFQYFPLTEVIK